MRYCLKEPPVKVTLNKTGSGVGKMTDIIIIEDDPEFGQLLLSFITKEGFSAELCASAETALKGFLEKSLQPLKLSACKKDGRKISTVHNF